MFLNSPSFSTPMIRRVSLEKEQLRVEEYAGKDSLSSKGLSWLRVVDPSGEELDQVAGLLSLDKQDKEDIEFFLKEGGRSRVEKGNLLLIVYSVPVIVDGDVETEHIMIFARRGLVVTLEAKKVTICENAFERAQHNKGKYLFKRNAGFFVTELIDEINTRFLRHVNRIEERIDVLESSSKLLTRAQVEAVASANSTLSFFNQSTMANIEVLNSLRKTYHESLSADNREEFQDIYYDALQILDALKLQREAIMNLFNMQSIISANSMNVFMKKLTALALIIAIPTLISSIYGMNVVDMPLAQHANGFWLILAVMVLITVILILVFFKREWL
jgi:magnesium transporter